MQQQPAYHIKHIYLHKQQALPDINSLSAGNYLVFWWNDVALGQLFIEPSHQLTEQVYYSELIKAIRPAVQQYAQNTQPEVTEWEQLLLSGDMEGWRQWMDSVFSYFTPEHVPQVVPVSVIICTRNRAKYLTQCIEQLSRLNCTPDEIIVVDNAPSDGSTYQAATQFNNVIYIKEPRPGLDIARNTGVINAKNSIVAFTDDDVLVHPMWVYWVWQTFQNNSVGAMTGLIIAAELRTKAQVNFEKFWSFNRGYVDKTYTRDFINSTLAIGPPVWEIGAGANMAFRKSVFEEVGLFNELLDVGAAGCNGDSEMWYRLLVHGHAIHYNPRATVYHEHRSETKGLKRQLFYYMRGFTVAALLQQWQQEKAGYKNHLFKVLPKFYIHLIKSGFPYYRSRTSTIWSEMRGILSGLLFFKRNQAQLLKSTRK